MEALAEVFSERLFMPHGHCYLWTPALVWLQVISNGLIGLSYVAISATLGVLIARVRDLPFKAIYAAFGVFIISCGFTHFMDIWVIWSPRYWFDAQDRFVLEPKDDIKARGLPSPDLFDALGLTFAFPVQKASRAHAERHQAETLAYDPLAALRR